MVDVVVVGASVAGATAAVHLARAGRSVLLLERATEPRRKACGEGLFPAGVAELDRLGLLSALLPYTKRLDALCFEIRGRTVEAPLGTPARPALGVQREAISKALLQLATKDGVDVRLGVRVEGLVRGDAGFGGVSTDHGPFEARVVIAADGAGSHLRRAAGLDAPVRGRRYGVSAHYGLSGAAGRRVDVHFRPGHEVYVTPVGERLVNVAVLMGRAETARLAGRLEARYAELVAASRALPGGARLVDDPMVAGPFPVQAKRAWRDNLVLVGDAAGFYDGVTGEGMSLALLSARLCADAVHQHLAGNVAAFATYDRKRRDLARNSQWLGRLILLFASHPAQGARAVANMAKRPETLAAMLAINQGDRGFASLRPRDVLAMLFGL